MTQHNPQSETNYVISIGREYGSGGRAVGRQVAQLLNIDYYDKELLTEAAKISGIQADIFEKADERSPRFFAGIWSFTPRLNSGGTYYYGESPLSDERIYNAQSNVIRTLPERGSCVIVGRTADYILRNVCHVVSVFIHAPIDACVDTIVQRGECDTREQALKLAEKRNKLRAEYYNFYTDKRWGDAASYDLCIDSSILGIDGTARLIAQFARAIQT